jgi:hypothetical protein
VQAFGAKSKKASADKDRAPRQALDALSKFIPVEILAPYVAFLAYSIENTSPSPEMVYWCFVAATPISTIFFEYAKRAMDDMPWPAKSAVIWRSIAATLAFAVWGLTPPGSAFQSGVGGPVVAGLAAMIVSPVLTGADAIVLKLMGIRRISG